MPSELQKTYKHMWERTENRLKQRRTEDLNLFNFILKATLLAFRPLSLSELVMSANDPDVKTAVENCGSFLIINAETVSPIHLSAKEYYESRFGPAGVAKGHEDITATARARFFIVDAGVFQNVEVKWSGGGVKR